jgi:hypothetical protein
MAITSIGAIAQKLKSVIAGTVTEVGAQVGLVERPDNTLTPLQGNASGHAYVEISGGSAGLPSGASTSAKQDTQTGHLADLPGTTTHVSLSATTYDPPIRYFWNNGTGGTLSFKGGGDSAAVDMYVNQYEKVGGVQIEEVTSIGGGMALVGGS